MANRVKRIIPLDKKRITSKEGSALNNAKIKIKIVNTPSGSRKTPKIPKTTKHSKNSKNPKTNKSKEKRQSIRK